MKSGLESAYDLILENENKGTVKSNLKPGENMSGMPQKTKGTGPESTCTKKPVEGDAKINPGKGKIKSESNQKELYKMLPTSKFDSLYKTQLVEEEDLNSSESPLEIGGDKGFDDEEGDFPSEDGLSDDTTSEEVDVATELRMLIDRLTEIAEKLGAYDDDMDDADGDAAESNLNDDDDDDDDTFEGDDLDDEPTLTPESVSNKMKPFGDKSKKFQGPKSCNCVKSAFKVSNKKAATGAGGPGKGTADGKLSPAKKTDLGPKMSMRAKVKGTMGKAGAGIFDSI